MASGSTSFGDLYQLAGGSASLSRYRGGASASQHRHHDWYICLVLAGGFVQNGREERLTSPGDLVVLPPDRWHSDHVGPQGALCLNLHLNGAIAEQLMAGPRRADALGRSIAGELAFLIASGLVGKTLREESLIFELTGSLAGRASVKEAPGAIDQIVEAIEAQPDRSWRLQALADLVDLHPTHLARAFRMRTGIGIGAYRRRRRLTELCLDLRSDRRSLAELAADHGFADQPHMTRAVRRFTGFAPGEYRQRVRSGR